MRAGGDRGRETVEAGQDDKTGSDVGTASGPGAAGVHRHHPKPALGDGPHVRADLGGCRLRLLHIDAFSRLIAGVGLSPHMRTEMVLDAIDMARWPRGVRHDDLRCHSDAGSRFTSIRRR